MKNKIFALIILLLFSFNVHASETVRITNGEWPPWLSKDLVHSGVVSHIVTEAFALEGVKVEYGFFPWARGKLLAEKGKWDAAVAWNFNAEREKKFVYSDAVIEGGYVFFHLKSFKFDWNTFEDLEGITIGATTEYNYGQAFSDAEKGGMLKIKRLPSDKQNYLKLLKNRINLFPMVADIGYDIIAKNFTPEEVETITHHPKLLDSNTYHVIFSRQIDEKRVNFLKTSFNKGLKRLVKSGKYDQFIEESRSGMYKLPKK